MTIYAISKILPIVIYALVVIAMGLITEYIIER